MYVYIKTESELWTAGFYDPEGKFQPESDHGNKEEAAARVSFLNGNKEAVDNTRTLEILQTIIDDCETDVKEYDRKPFTGATVGALHGILEAKIQAIANIVKDHIGGAK